MIQVLTAVSPVLEAGVATRLEAVRGARLVRRCPDVADLLAAAAARVAQVAVISADLAGLDRGVLGQVRREGMTVVGVYAPGDQEAQRRLRQWGVGRLVESTAQPGRWLVAVEPEEPEEPKEPGDAGIPAGTPQLRTGGASPAAPHPVASAAVPSSLGSEFDAAIRRELLGGEATPPPPAARGASRLAPPGPVAAQGESATATPVAPGGSAVPQGSDPPAAVDEVPEARVPDLPGAGPSETEVEHGLQEPGTVVAVWGPVGSPGRTTLVVNLAAELARLGRSVLVVDADTYGSCVAQTLGLLDEAPGLAAATRLADSGDLDLPRLAAVAPQVVPGVRVLTGIPRAGRWSEIGQDSLAEVLRVCRLLAQVTLVDTGFCLEEDEELSYDTRAPRRNGATTTALREADEVVAVGSADPVGLQRLVRGLDELRPFTSTPRVVVNRVRSGAVGADPAARVTDTLSRFAGIEQAATVPDDRAALDTALLAGRTLAEVAPASPARAAVAALAGALVGESVPVRPRRRRLRRD